MDIIKLQVDKPIAVVGIMGVGKSFIGEKLAKNLGYEFCDSDALIVEKEGKTIAQIFDKCGEGYFRDIEADSISELLDKQKCVISTGGGALMQRKTLQNIKDKSISVWIKSDVDSILTRIKGDSLRPLLKCNNPRKKLANLLNIREILYSQADIHIDNSCGNAQNVVKQIIQELHKYE